MPVRRLSISFMPKRDSSSTSSSEAAGGVAVLLQESGSPRVRDTFARLHVARSQEMILLLKAAMLAAPFAMLLLPTLVHTIDTVVRAERSVTLREGVFNAELEGKLRAFLESDTGVIIAGDSRAERQIVPAVVEAITGRKAANIGVNAGDLVTFANALKRHQVPSAGRALIVSTSLFQANDGAIDPGYISTACFLNMTLRERLNVYADRLSSPLSPLDFSLIEGEPKAITDRRLGEQGFFGVDRHLELPLPEVLLDNHPWYRNLSLHGARWRVFEEALDRVAASDFRIYLIQPPVSPAWRAYTAGTFIDGAEREYGAMLSLVARKYANVRFLDFYSDPDARLGNDKFYDIQHVNRSGAETFTTILIQRIGGTL